MPSVRRALHARHGPLLDVSLRPEPLRAAMMRDAGRPVPEQIQGVALVDTGARHTCIDPEVAAQLYQQIGVAQAYTPSTTGEPATVPVFFATYGFPGTGLPDREQDLLGMPGLGYDVQGRRAVMLIGRDVLERFRFVYDGPAASFELRW